ncbi:MAG: hypothetical protein AAGH89_05810 [Verrucomicrobiota bacterium]
MKPQIIAILFFACSVACAQEPVILGVRTELAQGVSVSISLDGDLMGAEVNGSTAFTYGRTGRLEKIAGHKITYGLTGRPESVGVVQITYGLAGRPESIGAARLTYGLTGRLERIGGASLSYGLTGRLEKVVGKLPTGYRLEIRFLEPE